jgi:radical SAM superfamily enzyme YgiQ (UPF0313 family)
MGQLVASNTHPYGIGLIASSLLKNLPEHVEVELFKYPDDLNAALERRVPQVVGFSNYSWNCNLAHEYADRIKTRFPKTIVVFGGPNYGLSLEEQKAYWDRYPRMDFYVLKEGEVAMVELLRTLERYRYDADALKNDGALVPSCHYVRNGELVKGELLPRIKELGDVPSPYLAGLMDKFFDNILIPMSCTTRGCPFTCTFCQEGTSYYMKVTRRWDLAAELEYMAERRGTIQDLLLTNANFGMLEEDLDHARTIAGIQAKYGWPKHIHVSGGKNRKERLLEVATIINGAMNVAASLQSTDKTVLANVKRSNISLDQLNLVGTTGSKIDANTYTEIILGLPGDNWDAHAKSLRDSVNAGLGFVRMYQLIMLPETNMNTPETRKQFGMKTKFRVMPRCFGTYKFFGEEFACVEAEEICVAQDSLSMEDYIQCRELDLSVEITHNVNMFRELFGVLKHFGLSWFDFLMRYHQNRRNYSPGIAQLYDTFREDTIKPLWDTWGQLVDFAKSNLEKYILDELGTNELFKGKAVAFFRLQDDLHDALYGELEKLLAEKGLLDDFFKTYLRELKEFSQFRKKDLLNTSSEFAGEYHFDFRSIVARGYDANPKDFTVDSPVRYTFGHTATQKESMDAYIRQYGTSTLGLGRILMRAHVKRLFRNFQVDGEVVTKGFEDSYRRALNLHGD